MASQRERAPDGRALLTGGLALMGAAAGAAFGRLFLGQATTVRLAAAGALAALIAGALERRSIALGVGAGLGGLALFLGLSTFPETTLLGLPTPRTVAEAARALSNVGTDAAREYAPATPLPSLVAAATIAVWCGAIASHALAARASTPVLAILPCGLLLGFAASLAADGPRPGYAGTFLLGTLLMLLASGRRRLRSWGGTDGRALGGGTAARQARWLISGSLGLALLAPGVLPGLRSPAIVGLQGPLPAQDVGISPIVDIRPSLLDNRGIELLRVQAERPAYWRLTTLEHFDGRYWTAAERRGVEVVGPSDLPRVDEAPALGRVESRSETLAQEFEIVGLRADWLPAAAQPVAASLPGLATWEPSSGTLRPLDEAPRGYRYSVRSRLPVPTPQQLQDAGDFSHDQLGPAHLPPTTPGRVYEIAQRLAGSERTAYDKLIAIQDHLRTFTYDERAPQGHGTSDVLFFLDRSRRGYCEQFAGTMAVLARALGYSSRVAIGFTSGTPGPDGRYVVTGDDVHAWTEVLFPGHGWLAFEPTPARNNPVAGDYADPATAIVNPGATQGERARTQDREGGSSQREAGEQARPDPRLTPRPGDTARGPLRRVLPWGILAAALLPFALVAGRLGRRRMRLARAPTPRDRVLAAYELFEQGAGDVGYGRRASETPAEFARRLLADPNAVADGHLERLTALAVGALYSGREVTPAGSDAAVEASRAALRDVRRRAGRLRTAAGLLRTRS